MSLCLYVFMSLCLYVFVSVFDCGPNWLIYAFWYSYLRIFWLKISEINKLPT